MGSGLMRWLPIAVALAGIGAAAGSFYLIVDSADSLKDRSHAAEAAARAGDQPTLEVVQARADYGPAVATTLTLMIRSTPGAEPVALQGVVVEMDAPDGKARLRLGAAMLTPVRDVDGSLAGPHGLLQQGDLVEATFVLAELGIQLAPGQRIQLTLRDGHVATHVTFEAPARAVGNIVALPQIA